MYRDQKDRQDRSQQAYVYYPRREWVLSTKIVVSVSILSMTIQPNLIDMTVVVYLQYIFIKMKLFSVLRSN